MMTIKNFARLCSCETSALRYYDRIGLLKPVRVDEETGYRYYDEKQAVDFVKIKNLQQAQFSIKEIKRLIYLSDQKIAEAFDVKIKELESRLAKMIENQQTYLKEKKTMENLMETLSKYVLNQLNDPKKLEEFKMNPKDHDYITELLKEYMLQRFRKSENHKKKISLRLDDEVLCDKEEIENRIQNLNSDQFPDTVVVSCEKEAEENLFYSADYETVYEISGWRHIYEFIDDLPDLEKGREYVFDIHTQDESKCTDGSFALYMLGALIAKKNGMNICMGCNVNRSEDHQNHIEMYKK